MPKHLNGASMTDNSHQGPRSNEAAGSGAETEGGSPAHEFNQAVERLESSLRDLVDSKKDASLRQATSLIDEASSRLRSQTAEDDADARQGGERAQVGPGHGVRVQVRSPTVVD